MRPWSLTMARKASARRKLFCPTWRLRSEEHTSELQLPVHLVCRLLLEKKNAKRAASPLVLFHMAGLPARSALETTSLARITFSLSRLEAPRPAALASARVREGEQGEGS